MDAIDILGGLLGGGSSGSDGGLGGKILKDLLGGKRKPAPPRSTSTGRAGSRPIDIESEAKQLEDLLGVAKDRYQRQGRQGAQPTQSQRPHTQPESRQSGGASGSSPGLSFDDTAPVGRQAPLSPNDEALVLIRAMIQAAKSDGRITQEEQQAILDRISNPSREALSFLQREFQREADAREFSWSVPLGMEQKVYTLSLAAIDLDTNQEAKYLRELAHGLRIDPDVCNQIHQQYGLPTIY